MPKGTSGRGGSGGGSGGGGGGGEKKKEAPKKKDWNKIAEKAAKREEKKIQSTPGKQMMSKNQEKVAKSMKSYVDSQFKKGAKSVSIKAAMKHASKETKIPVSRIEKTLGRDNAIIMHTLRKSNLKLTPSRDVDQQVRIKSTVGTRGFSHFNKE